MHSLLIRGIVAPLANDDDRPSWGFLLLMGLIGGGPTFLGTAVGRQFTSEAVSVLERIKQPSDPAAEPWPPMRAGEGL